MRVLRALSGFLACLLAATSAHSEQSAMEVAVRILHPVQVARFASESCDGIAINQNGLRIHYLRAEETFREIGESSDKWLRIRYSESDFSALNEELSRKHSLTNESSESEVCHAIQREHHDQTLIGKLLLVEE